ncbi:MAG: helix-turn-helix domain-containing protein [Betaproteobacteria bacterium]
MGKGVRWKREPMSQMRQPSSAIASVGKVVRALREEQRLAQAALAFRVGTSQAHISRLESGAGDVSLKLLDSIAKALGVNVNRLYASASSEAAVVTQPRLPDEEFEVLARGGIQTLSCRGRAASVAPCQPLAQLAHRGASPRR